MPTLTRLAATLGLGLAVLYAGTRYHLLYDEPPRSISGIIFVALVAAAVGWKYAGPRLGAGALRNFFIVVQGYLLTLILSLILLGFYNAFTMGYARRYRTLDDAFEGIFVISIDHLTRMSDLGFLSLLLGLALAITVLVTLVFHLAERRRFD